MNPFILTQTPQVLSELCCNAEKEDGLANRGQRRCCLIYGPGWKDICRCMPGNLFLPCPVFKKRSLCRLWQPEQCYGNSPISLMRRLERDEEIYADHSRPTGFLIMTRKRRWKSKPPTLAFDSSTVWFQWLYNTRFCKAHQITTRGRRSSVLALCLCQSVTLMAIQYIQHLSGTQMLTSFCAPH